MEDQLVLHFFYTFVPHLTLICGNEKKVLGIALILWSIAAAAQTERPWRVGVVGGVNQTQLENYGSGLYVLCDFETRWQAGVAFQYSQPFQGSKLWNWSIQPELRYMVSSTYIEPIYAQLIGRTTLEMIDLPVNAQFGLRLSPIFRPFVTAGISFGYTINEQGDLFEGGGLPTNKFQFGVGAGVGFNPKRGVYRAALGLVVLLQGGQPTVQRICRRTLFLAIFGS